MSFARQISICRRDDNVLIAPTEQEIQLSRLQRPGMNANHRIRQILRPGKYAFGPLDEPPWRTVDQREPDVVQRRADLVRRPRRVRLDDVIWNRSQELNWTAYLSTESRTISIPIDVADDVGLGYYDCRLISPDDVISLNHRSLITNFHYHDDYFRNYVLGVLGFSSIEQHEFAHVDTPLDDRSGHLVIGRMDPLDQSLELTAFVVKPGDSVYIPAHTIHTNDYLLGTWETLLSSACEFPSAQIRQSTDEPMEFVYDQAASPFRFVE